MALSLVDFLTTAPIPIRTFSLIVIPSIIEQLGPSHVFSPLKTLPLTSEQAVIMQFSQYVHYVRYEYNYRSLHYSL